MTELSPGSVSLYSLASWTNGLAFRSIEFSDVGRPIIKISEVKNGLSGQTKFTEAEYDPKYRIRSGDMIFCWSGQPETSIGTYYWRGPDGWLNQHLFRVQPRSEDVVDAFFYYLLLDLNPRFVELARNKQTTGLGHVTKRDLQDITLNLPPLEEQRRIAGVLGALDDLADTEMRISADCGQLWRAVVSRNMDEQGSAPAPLSALASFVNGRNFTKGATGQGRPIIRTPEVRGGPTASTVRTDVDADADRVARFGDVLFVWSGSLCCARWAFEEALVNQHVFKASPLDATPDWLVMFALERQMPWFLSLAQDKATTMGHIQRRHLDESVELPVSAELSQLDAVVRPFWDQELESRAAARSAMRLRDELLPLLMSGRVRVGEVAT